MAEPQNQSHELLSIHRLENMAHKVVFGDKVSIDTQSGEIKMLNGASPDDAAKAFWRAVENIISNLHPSPNFIWDAAPRDGTILVIRPRYGGSDYVGMVFWTDEYGWSSLDRNESINFVEKNFVWYPTRLKRDVILR